MVFEFAATFVIESVVVLALIRVDAKKVFLYEFLINLFTWPLANSTFFFFQSSAHISNIYPALAVILIIEALVVLTEGLLIKMLFEIRQGKALLVSLAANSASFFLGGAAVYLLRLTLLKA